MKTPLNGKRIGLLKTQLTLTLFYLINYRNTTLLSAQEIVQYQAKENLLKDRIIMITGAGSGIGKAAAITFAAAGATVILAGRTVEKLEAVYDQIIQSGGEEPLIYPVDFEGATEDDFNELANQIDQQFGRLDGLLLNAGVLGQRTPLSKYRQDVWSKVLQVNLTSQHLLTKALMPILEVSDNASVIFTTSGVGRVGRAFWGAYAVSKFAVEGMVQTWAAENNGLNSVRMNCINPGATSTQMRATAFPAENPESIASPEDIMPAYLYLMGSESSDVNGQSIDAQIK
jgi:NAD(P)-dependent dehydrogenase (short-subunit alcohol dehydrogenase family)